jgi:DNA mismatch repair protein MSH6
MTHPGVKMKNLKSKFGNKLFVPNSTELSTRNEPAKSLLVTGPNMGGKSTLLRQTCLAVILA